MSRDWQTNKPLKIAGLAVLAIVAIYLAYRLGYSAGFWLGDS